MCFILKSVLLLISILISVAYFTLLERQLMGILQRRKGPTIVGFSGLLQPLADGVKLFFKEIIFPNSANKILFICAPLLAFFISLSSWAIIPYSESVYYLNLNLTLLYILSLSSLTIYGIIISGWASNSNYAFLGCLRSTAQMISYELSLSFIIITVCLHIQSFNLIDIILIQKKLWNIFLHCPLFFIFFISILAETNRHPFDLPEAESELVSGYNIEYSSLIFAFFFLSEYANILILSFISSSIFFGGWFLFSFTSPFILIFKTLSFALIFIILRSILPRYRFDQLLLIGWKIIIPFSLFYLYITLVIIKYYTYTFFLNFQTYYMYSEYSNNFNNIWTF